MSKETDPKDTVRKARRQGVDKKGLEDERRGRESKGQERTGEPLGENQQRNKFRKAGDVEEGKEKQTQENRMEAKRQGAMASLSLRGSKISQTAFCDVILNADDACGHSQ